MRLSILAGALLLLAAAGVPSAEQGGPSPPFPQVSIDLGTLPGGRFSTAHGINLRGDVVGDSNIPGGNGLNTHAFYWAVETGMVDLGTVDSDSNSKALAINGRRQIVGVSQSGIIGNPRAVLWEVDDQGHVQRRLLLGNLPDGSVAVPRSINEAGEVVGEATTDVDGDTVLRPFYWTEDTGMVELAPLPEQGPMSTATSINNLGRVSGYVTDDFNRDHAFLLTVDSSGQVEMSSGLENPVLGGTLVLGSQATAVNELGHTAGITFFVLDEFVRSGGTFWIDPFSAHFLGGLPGGTRAACLSLNNADQAVGVATIGRTLLARGVVWSPRTGMRDLSLVQGGSFLEVTRAEHINDAAQIAASGLRDRGDIHALLLNLCPEDVRGRLRLARGPARVLTRPRRLRQTIIVQNLTTAPLAGPAFLAVRGLPLSNPLLNADGLTTCAEPIGVPFRRLPLGPDGVLTPGEEARVVLEIAIAGQAVPAFDPRVMAGGLLP